MILGYFYVVVYFCFYFYEINMFILIGIGLLYVDASVWQMLRGSIIIFTGIFSVSNHITKWKPSFMN